MKKTTLVPLYSMTDELRASTCSILRRLHRDIGRRYFGLRLRCFIFFIVFHIIISIKF
jgi:hypothetical protein